VTRQALAALTAAIVLFAPSQQGGRTPVGLLVLHMLAILWVLCASSAGALRPWRPPDPTHDPLLPFVLLAGATLLAVCFSALRAAYPLAAGLGAWDIVVPCALFVAAACRPGRDDDLIRLRAVLVASTSAQAVLALCRYAEGGAEAAGESFLNPNHLAAFLNLGLFPCLTAAGAPGARRGARLLWGAAAVVNLAALAVLESRGAFLALITVLLVFGARRFSAWTPRARIAAACLVLLCGLIAFVALGHRFARSGDPYRYHRLSIWRASSRVVAERPILGHGPGMFPHVAPKHNFPAGPGPVFYGRSFTGAHCAYLTLAAEIGLPAVLCLAAAGFGLVVLFLRRGDRTAVGAAVAGSGLGLLALLVQGGVEDLQERPALTLVPALLAGIAFAAVRRRREATTSAGRAVDAGPAIGRTQTGWSRPRAGWAAAVAGAAAVYLMTIAVLLPYLADREARAALRLGRAGLHRMERAAALNPLQPEYRHDLAMAILNSGPLTADGFAEAEDDLLEARRLKPIDYRFPLLLARLKARFASRLFDDRTAAESAAVLYREAARLAPLNPLPRLELAGELVELQRPEEALAVIREALRLEPNFLRARILEASILLDMGHEDEARVSLAAAVATAAALADYAPDSGYAREITLDAKSERDRLAERLDSKAASASLRF